MSEHLTDTLARLCEAGRSFYERGYAFGSTGNLSIRDGDAVWITPTGYSLKDLTPEQLARVDAEGNALGANRPSKEYPFHLAIYRHRSEARAIVHLHSPYSVALACLDSIEDFGDPLPALTPYYFMRVAPLGVVPYFRPGSPELAAAVERLASAHHCLLLRNHGLICAGSSLTEAVDRAEELEQTAKLYFTLRGERLRLLSDDEIRDLQRAFPS